MALARAVVAARLAPRGLDTPQACMIAILHGLEVGLTPLAALQRIAVIDGRATIWGDGALALVRASGLLASIDEVVAGSDEFGWVATCTLQRRGDPEPLERSFSVADAIRAGLWRKPGPWSDYPRRMLQMRARAFALRDAFPDVLGGLYLREEFEGMTRAPSAPSACRDERSPVNEPIPEWPPAPAIHPTHTGGERDPGPAQGGHDDGSRAPSRLSPPLTPAPHPTLSLRRSPPWRRLGEVAGPIAARLATRLTPSPAVPDPDDGTALNAVPPASGPPHPVPPRAHDTPAAMPEPWLTPRDLLTDYDNALCCAQDRDTLDEIAEEFSLALDRIPEDDQFAASLILARHELRVAALETGDPA